VELCYVGPMKQITKLSGCVTVSDKDTHSFYLSVNGDGNPRCEPAQGYSGLDPNVGDSVVLTCSWLKRVYHLGSDTFETVFCFSSVVLHSG
jgi:hypothetical protein